MSREVRRVPLDWEHPTAINRYSGKTEPIGLFRSYPEAVSMWAADREKLAQRIGFDWNYGSEAYADDFVSDDELHEYLMGRQMSEHPLRSSYMPVWPEGAELGWCLYETVSEGTPVTPVFATAEELIDHLVAVGDWHGPYRREAAEQLVGDGGSFGTFMAVGGKLLNSAQDADVIANLPKRGDAS